MKFKIEKKLNEITMLKRIIFNLLGVVFILLLVGSCNKKWDMPAELVGDWESGLTDITVRTEPKSFEFEFFKGSGIIALTIFEDKTAEGTIGTATFENAEVRKNSGIPSITGVAYTIKCGAISEIFDGDPLNSKKVEIWLGPLKEDQTMEAELRFTEGGAHFPMSGFELKK